MREDRLHLIQHRVERAEGLIATAALLVLLLPLPVNFRGQVVETPCEDIPAAAAAVATCSGVPFVTRFRPSYDWKRGGR